MATKTWVGVTIAIVAFLGVYVLAVGGFGFYVFVSHVDIDDASAAVADRSFDEARARFVGEQPLLSLSDHEWTVNRAPPIRPPSPGRCTSWRGRPTTSGWSA